MEEILRDLARLRRTGTLLQELMTEVQRAAPERSEGTDPTGMVRAVLGPDGLPESIQVSSYWKEKLPAASLGAAVTAACRAAMQRRGAAWAEVLERSGWEQRLEGLDADAASTAALAPDPVPPAFRRPGHVPPRPLDVLAEESMSTLDAAMRPPPRMTPSPGAGANRARTLEIILEPGGEVSCRADPRWASRLSGAQLSAELASVLAMARRGAAEAAATKTEAEAGRAAGQERRENLLNELLSVLGDTQRLSEM
jgi:hypothetical protein